MGGASLAPLCKADGCDGKVLCASTNGPQLKGGIKTSDSSPIGQQPFSLLNSTGKDSVAIALLLSSVIFFVVNFVDFGQELISQGSEVSI